MQKRDFIKIGIISALLLVALAAVIFFLPRKQIMLGVWTEGLYKADTRSLHPEILTQFEKMTDKKYSIAHFYRGWESFVDPKLVTEFSTLRKNGWMPMLNANPYYFSECVVKEEPIYTSIAQGHCDAFLHKAGKNLSTVNEPFYLLFAWEMNNKDVEWSIPYTRSSPADFIAAWRRIHTIFKEEKATNIVWVFCPNVPDVSDALYRDLYPGDEYVDWVCLDGYNWGTAKSWSTWTKFSDVFRSSYKTLVGIAPEKPMLIAEVNTTDVGGDKPKWYRDMLLRELPNDFPQVQAVVFFNEDRSKQEGVNWKVDVTKESLEAFKEGVNSDHYQ